MTADQDEPTRILVFGDSNSWGWVPRDDDEPTVRYPAVVRWPERMAADLARRHGPVDLVVDAVSGRTTDVDDPNTAEFHPPLDSRNFNGAQALPAVIAAHMPLDRVVIMLGTNDAKAAFARDARTIAHALVGIGVLAERCTGVATAYPRPKAFLVAPPPLGPLSDAMAEDFIGGPEISRAVGPQVLSLAKAVGLAAVDAGAVVPAIRGVDGVHFTAEDHAAVAAAVADGLLGVMPSG